MDYLDTFNEAWDVICDYLKNKKDNGKKAISDVAYNAWIKKIQPVGIDFENGRIILTVPNKLNKTISNSQNEPQNKPEDEHKQDTYQEPSHLLRYDHNYGTPKQLHYS